MGALERVEEGVVGFIDQGGGAFCAALVCGAGVAVGVSEGLELEVFAAEGGEGDGEGGVRGWAVGEGFGEEGVVRSLIGSWCGWWGGGRCGGVASVEEG